MRSSSRCDAISFVLQPVLFSFSFHPLTFIRETHFPVLLYFSFVILFFNIPHRFVFSFVLSLSSRRRCILSLLSSHNLRQCSFSRKNIRMLRYANLSSLFFICRKHFITFYFKGNDNFLSIFRHHF